MSFVSIYPQKSIKQLAEIKGGKRLPAGHSFSLSPTQYSYIRAQDIRHGKIETPSVFIEATTYEALHRYRVFNGDVLITIAGNIADIGYVDQTLNGVSLTENAVRLTGFNRIDSKYLAYALQIPDIQAEMKASAAGAAQPKLGIYKVKDVYLPVPDDVFVQKRISLVLSAYDDLIDTNRRRIALLEESARLLYREWFVNLRFPGHELVKWQDGLPEGWLPAALTELVNCSPKTVFEKGKSYPFVPMQSLSESGMVIGTREERVISGGAKFQNLDTLLARITPCLENGKTAFVQFLDEERPVASGSTEFIVMRSKTVNPYWVYCLARDESFREHAIRSMAGADGRQRVNPKCFETYMTYQAPELILKEFETLVAPVFEQVETLARQNVVLMAARDELLPKLMSGAIRA